jgi:hypothetical protein
VSASSINLQIPDHLGSWGRAINLALPGLREPKNLLSMSGSMEGNFMCSSVSRRTRISKSKPVDLSEPGHSNHMTYQIRSIKAWARISRASRSILSVLNPYLDDEQVCYRRILSLGTRHDQSYRLFHRNLMIALPSRMSVGSGFHWTTFNP